MNSLPDLLQQGASAWLFIPSAILLGALHGLEPGHSKTMMAAFIIAIRGTVGQAVLLGLSATLSHTAVVWAVALGGQYFGRHWGSEASEPYFQLASAVIMNMITSCMITSMRLTGTIIITRTAMGISISATRTTRMRARTPPTSASALADATSRRRRSFCSVSPAG